MRELTKSDLDQTFGAGGDVCESVDYGLGVTTTSNGTTTTVIEGGGNLAYVSINDATGTGALATPDNGTSAVTQTEDNGATITTGYNTSDPTEVISLGIGVSSSGAEIDAGTICTDPTDTDGSSAVDNAISNALLIWRNHRRPRGAWRRDL